MSCITINNDYKHQSHIFRNVCEGKETRVCAQVIYIYMGH